MRSLSNLYEKMLEEEYVVQCIHDAFVNKKRNKKAEHIYRHPQYHAKIIIKELQKGTIPKQHQRKGVTIFEPNSQKSRTLIKPTEYEHIIHHMICGLLKNTIQKSLYNYVVAAIPNKGDEYGKRALEKWIRKYNGSDFYVLKVDVKKFFDSIDRDILFKKLSKLIKDNRFLEIIRRVLWYDNNPQGVGIPIGFYTSQWFSNFYLKDFDHFIMQELKPEHEIRYMDDVVILDKDKNKLHDIREKIQKYLIRISLELKSNYQVFKFEDLNSNDRAIDFMGFVFHRNRTTLRKSTLKRARRKDFKLDRKKKINWYEACQLLSYYSRLSRCKTALYVERYMHRGFLEHHCKQIVSKHFKEVNKIDIQKSKRGLLPS